MNSGGPRGALMHSIAGALGLSLTLASAHSPAAGTWGGSVALTSDYFVRGVTRTDDQAALQIDLHYADSSGIVAGAFASNTQIDAGHSRDVELNGYLGFVWTGSGDWHGRVLGGYYAYPWNEVGSSYNYGELDLDLGYQEWLDVGMSDSPDAPRYLNDRGLVGSVCQVAGAESAASADRQTVGGFGGRLLLPGGSRWHWIHLLECWGHPMTSRR